MTDTDWSEHYIRRGDPNKPTYYIIRRQPATNGLFARYNVFAGHIAYALSKDWLPVIDMQNYPNIYLAPEKLGKENSWEYYFEQPLRIGLEQAYGGENVVLCDDTENIDPAPRPIMRFYENRNGLLDIWRALVKASLLKVKPERMAEILSVRQKLFAPTDRVLGVLLRGTDYLSEKPFDHPIPPPIEFAVSTVVAKLQEWKCNRIFLATEDKDIVQTFKNFFGDICLTYDREYVNYVPGKRLGYYSIERPNDHFLQGKDYLTQMVLASMCNCFVAARCQGSVSVMMMADKFEQTYFFNLGRYGVITLD